MRCDRCGADNPANLIFCRDCGNRLPERAAPAIESDSRLKLHADIAHPINAASREVMQKRIIEAYMVEVEKSKLPGYKPVEIYESSEEYDL